MKLICNILQTFLELASVQPSCDTRQMITLHTALESVNLDPGVGGFVWEALAFFDPKWSKIETLSTNKFLEKE